ncbi:MAG: hypothetical protein ACRDJ9_22440, partial [Dehalococcoidia bacterium]
TTTMALSMAELELQSTEYLPQREVMTAVGAPSGHDGNHTDGPETNTYLGGLVNDLNVQEIAPDVHVSDVQVSLVNVDVHDVQDVVNIASADNEFMTQLGY